MVSCSTNYKLEYSFNKTALNNLLLSMHIKSSGLPQSVVIIIDQNNIKSNSVKVSWGKNIESVISQYKIQYAKFKPIISKSKGKKKGKNKKKKRRKKKGKKKRKYDSSSSDSDSDSSSSSSSSSSDSSSIRVQIHQIMIVRILMKKRLLHIDI